MRFVGGVTSHIGEAMFISITRLQLRSALFLPLFFWHNEWIGFVPRSVEGFFGWKTVGRPPMDILDGDRLVGRGRDARISKRESAPKRNAATGGLAGRLPSFIGKRRRSFCPTGKRLIGGWW